MQKRGYMPPNETIQPAHEMIGKRTTTLVPLPPEVAFVHSVDKTWSFLLSIKDAHDLAVAINDLQAADDYGSVHIGVSVKSKRSSCRLRVILSAKPGFYPERFLTEANDHRRIVVVTPNGETVSGWFSGREASCVEICGNTDRQSIATMGDFFATRPSRIELAKGGLKEELSPLRANFLC
jgi:hypothetical protein